MQNRSKTVDMTTGAPLNRILVFMIPLLIGSVFQQMYSNDKAVIFCK